MPNAKNIGKLLAKFLGSKGAQETTELLPRIKKETRFPNLEEVIGSNMSASSKLPSGSRNIEVSKPSGKSGAVWDDPQGSEAYREALQDELIRSKIEAGKADADFQRIHRKLQESEPLTPDVEQEWEQAMMRQNLLNKRALKAEESSAGLRESFRQRELEKRMKAISDEQEKILKNKYSK